MRSGVNWDGGDFGSLETNFKPEKKNPIQDSQDYENNLIVYIYI